MFTQDTMLRHHLQHNHYPPLPAGLVPYAAEAIRLANDGGNWDAIVEITTVAGDSTLVKPDGSVATVSDLVEDLHLHSFIDDLTEEED